MLLTLDWNPRALPGVFLMDPRALTGGFEGRLERFDDDELVIA